MKRIFYSVLLVFVYLSNILGYIDIYTDISFNNEGLRGILDLYDAKTMKRGRMAIGVSPLITWDKIGIVPYTRTDNPADITWDDYVAAGLTSASSRINSTLGIFAPVFFSYGLFNYWSVALGVYSYWDQVYDVNNQDLEKKGTGDFFINTKLAVPTNQIVNLAFVFTGYVPTNKTATGLKTGYILRDPQFHWKATMDGPEFPGYKNAIFGTYTANHSRLWALKALLALTFDVGAVNPDLLLRFHFNVGGLGVANTGSSMDSKSYTDNKIFGKFGVEYCPHPSFGFFGSLSGAMEWSNVINHHDLFKDELNGKFGLLVRSPHASIIMSIMKTFSSPEIVKDRYVLNDDDPAAEKTYKDNLNHGLYYIKDNNNIYLVNAHVPPKLGASAQVTFHWFIIPPDQDKDGINDRYDKCPTEPEDFDGFQDDDGCPDLDNDLDKIPDKKDKCPNDPEDYDSFQDDDGCPDPDNDKDGIADVDDKCPGTDQDALSTKEDLDGFQDNDGCPDLDNDKDGIPDQLDKCPNQPETKNGIDDSDGCPDNIKDSDHDGIDDKHDKCPFQPEDIDGFQDKDGCPDPDNDQDGIPDVKDKCPGTDKTVKEGKNTRETYNGIDDEDGCPEEIVDKDGDGIDDKVDKCPLQPEDIDGFQDKDGCPDPDNDQDGIPDVKDKCPGTDKTVKEGKNTKETYNGFEDEDGCPDQKPVIKKPPKKKFIPQRFRLKVFFKTGSARLTPDSYPALNDLCAKLKANPKVKILIEGHTDNRGSFKYNMRLSRRRAMAVKRYLVKKCGIDPSRIKTKGYGPTKPIADNSTPEGRELNRRIEVKRLN